MYIICTYIYIYLRSGDVGDVQRAYTEGNLEECENAGELEVVNGEDGLVEEGDGDAGACVEEAGED